MTDRNSKQLKILKFGWEFPPYSTGGLAFASRDITSALASEGIDVTFVLPRYYELDFNQARFKFADFGREELREAVEKEVSLSRHIPGYVSSESYEEVYAELSATDKLSYAPTLFEEVLMYGKEGARIALEVDAEDGFDVIHAHDWLAYKAGMAAKRVTGKPLVLHVHATQYNQAGGRRGDEVIMKIESEAFALADRVIAISKLVKEILVKEYGVEEKKIEVIYNGVTEMLIPELSVIDEIQRRKSEGKKMVLYLGRVTIQKGPQYFLEIAQKTLEHYPDSFFVMAGAGDLLPDMINLAKTLGIEDDVYFPGGVWGDTNWSYYHEADLFILPSLSEPFGLTPLEAITMNTPVVISKQVGAAEILDHALKADFWDVDGMVNQVVNVLKSESLGMVMQRDGREEIEGITWEKAAKQCVTLYKTLLNS